MQSLTPEKALIFRITHIANIPWILDHGLLSRNSPEFDPNYRNIGNPDLIDKRSHRAVPLEPGGTLSDYIPFYFTPRSPMLLNVKTGHNVVRTPMAEIVMLVASLHTLARTGRRFLFTDRHAYLQAANFSSNLDDLSRIDWDILQRGDFKRDPDDPGKMERYQAEALVHRHLPITDLSALVCYDEVPASRLRSEMENRGLGIKIISKPSWYV